MLVFLPDGPAVGHILTHNRITDLRFAQVVCVKETGDPFPMPGVVEDGILEAGGRDVHEVQLCPLLFLNAIEKGVEQAPLWLPDCSHQPLDAATEQAFLARIKAGAIIDVAADDNGDTLSLLAGHVRV